MLEQKLKIIQHEMIFWVDKILSFTFLVEIKLLKKNNASH